MGAFAEAQLLLPRQPCMSCAMGVMAAGRICLGTFWPPVLGLRIWGHLQPFVQHRLRLYWFCFGLALQASFAQAAGAAASDHLTDESEAIKKDHEISLRVLVTSMCFFVLGITNPLREMSWVFLTLHVELTYAACRCLLLNRLRCIPQAILASHAVAGLFFFAMPPWQSRLT
jgi:hypothetical protein